ncbi:hypothetical protein [Xanthomonas campestris]|uniref:hypothetical protein n=1 Tax=Xanthomonas campestris TaxID=339 RepID=UPI001D152DBA|nr:hypothetical protein [Xanthomonas campestris]MCC3255410.1 hypothetical protein [Xanthomonas campestris pv. armoraciae]
MASKTSTIELANFVCRFGEKVMLDEFDKIVYPAFFKDSLKRKYGETKFFFEKVNLVKVKASNDSEALAIAGRIIKDTVLRRDQVYVPGEGLRQKKGRLASAPSSIFLLILDNHRLVFVKETPDVPTKEQFRSTALVFLRQMHAALLKKELINIDEMGLSRDDSKREKEKIYKKYERPTLEMIALTSQDSIEDFIQKYEILNQVKITINDRNDEFNSDGFFESLKESKDAIKSDDTAVVHNSKEGLDKNEAVSQVSSATAQGHQTVSLKGKDESGGTLIGNNEHFQLKKKIDEISSDPVDAAAQMFEAFTDLVAHGLVKVPNTARSTSAKIKEIIEKRF